MKKIRRIFFLFVCVALVVGACATPVATTSSEPLRVAVSDWPGDYPLILARELGLYRKYNVNVELTYNEIYGQTVTQFTSGQIDTFNSTIGDVLLMSPKTDFKIVLISDSSEGADAIVALPSITNPRELRGRRLGVDLGTVMGELFIRQMFLEYGLTRRDVQLVDIAPEFVPDALGRDIDAGHTWAPFTGRATSAGNRIIFTSASTPNLFPDVLVFHTTTLQARPDDVRNLLLAWFEAAEYLRTNRIDANLRIAGFLEKRPSEISTEGLRIYSLEDNRNAFARNEQGTSLYDTLQKTADFMAETGLISRRPNFSDLIDTSFLP
jgi:NitT/TauT family transport system substrate-binding protein